MKTRKHLLFAVCFVTLTVVSCGKSSTNKTSYSLAFNGFECTSDALDSYYEGEEVCINITPSRGYVLPDSIIVVGSDYVYDQYDGTLKFVMSENTFVHCTSNYVGNYYVSKTSRDGVLNSASTLSTDEKTFVLQYGLDCEDEVNTTTNKYNDKGRLISSEEIIGNQDFVDTNTTQYIYDGNKLMKEVFHSNAEDDGYNAIEYEYDSRNRLIKEIEYEDCEFPSIDTHEYPDNFTEIHRHYWGGIAEDYLFSTETNVTTIDFENNTKRVDVTTIYSDDDHAYEGYYLYTLDTNKMLEIFYSDWSAHYFYSYNENGDMISKLTKKYNKETQEWEDYTINRWFYNEDRTLKRNEEYSYDNNEEILSFSIDYECNQNGFITKEIFCYYENGIVVNTIEDTFEYKEIKSNIYDNLLSRPQTIGTYDYDFWY